MISKTLNYIAAVALLSLCQPVLASDWQFLGNSTAPEGEILIDKDSIRFTGDTAKAWSKWVYAVPQELAGAYPKKTYQSDKILRIYNCAAKTSAVKQIVYYATADGEDAMDTLQVKDSELDFSDVIPDSIGEAQLDWVCQQKPAHRR